MKVGERWLREWIDPPLDTAALAEQLTSLGLEVDSLESARPDFEGVVVARIEAVRPHPNADRLRVCDVVAGPSGASAVGGDGEGGDVGDRLREGTLQVVCGAPNAREGLVTALARVGGRLPDGTRLKKAKLRGVESFGMLCSAAELGLAEERGGILELADDAPPGAELGAWLGLDDTVIDIDLTPDRADCLSVRGLARELSAKNDLPLRVPEPRDVPDSIDDRVAVTLEPGAACARFVGRVIRDVDMRAEVPPTVVERLRHGGVRSIGPAVDVTAHVMLELGQPMHAFDLDKLAGGIRVRLAEEGERLTLLDGREVTLDATTTVIADDSGAIAIAGVMGGLSTAVEADTTNVLLESALFLPAHMVGRARRYGLHTDASHRFERGVDPAAQREAIEAASALLVEIAGGRAGPVVEALDESRLPRRETVTLRASRLARVLGASIEGSEVERILARLGIGCEPLEGGWRVTPPSHRYDLEIEEDYIEEVGRVHGYDALPRSLPTLAPTFRAEPETLAGELAPKRLLAHRGYQEVVTYSFVDGARQAILRPDLDAIALPNPISSELGVMRTTLVPGLLEVYRRNAARQIDSMRLFESGLRFLGAARDAHLEPTHGDDLQIDETPSAGVPAGVRQQSTLAGLAVGRREPESWNTGATALDFYAVKADVEALLVRLGGEGVRFAPSRLPMLHPGQGADILVDDVPLGYVGALNPALQAPLDLPGLPFVFELSAALPRVGRLPRAGAPSRFPAVRRDLALLVDAGLGHDALVASVLEDAPETLREARVFDVYRGGGLEKGKKSMALGLILQDFSRTLDEGDVERVVAGVVAALERRHGAKVRER